MLDISSSMMATRKQSSFAKRKTHNRMITFNDDGLLFGNRSVELNKRETRFSTNKINETKGQNVRYVYD